MTTLTQDIQDKLKNLTAFEKIIAVNVLIYIVGWFIFKIYNFPITDRSDSLVWLALPSSFSEFIMKPWTLFTYGFAHVDFWHLFFNMFVLYFVGRSFSNLFNIKLSLNVYFLGILFGGIVYLLVYNLFPSGMLKNAGILFGASAGVRAALIFLSAYMPNYEIRIVSFNIQLKYIAFILVGLDILGLFGTNQGGYVAHLGGDLLGYMYGTQLLNGKDIGKGFERFMDRIVGMFSLGKRSKLKTVHKKTTYAGHTKEEFNEFNNQKQIDIILDKISKSGYDSLTQEEKEFLFKSGK